MNLIKRKLNLIQIILLLVAILFVIYFFESNYNDMKKTQKKYDTIPRVDIFDLGTALNPAKTYEKIQCRKSSVLVVQTMLCVHDINKDVHVSSTLLRDGCWDNFKST